MNATTFTRKILTCPACDGEIHATFSASLGAPEIPDIPNGTVDVKLSVTGMSVNHTCIPQPKRDGLTAGPYVTINAR